LNGRYARLQTGAPRRVSPSGPHARRECGGHGGTERRRLDAISVEQDGKAASANTLARKRSVFANVIRYAVELEEMPSNPLDRLSCPRSSTAASS
jgi:site-specific recombinase XerC